MEGGGGENEDSLHADGGEKKDSLHTDDGDWVGRQCSNTDIRVTLMDKTVLPIIIVLSCLYLYREFSKNLKFKFVQESQF